MTPGVMSPAWFGGVGDQGGRCSYRAGYERRVATERPRPHGRRATAGRAGTPAPRGSLSCHRRSALSTRPPPRGARTAARVTVSRPPAAPRARRRPRRHGSSSRCASAAAGCRRPRRSVSGADHDPPPPIAPPRQRPRPAVALGRRPGQRRGARVRRRDSATRRATTSHAARPGSGDQSVGGGGVAHRPEPAAAVPPAPPGRPTTGRTPPSRSCSPRSTSATACGSSPMPCRSAPSARRCWPASTSVTPSRPPRWPGAAGEPAAAGRRLGRPPRPPRAGRRPRRRRCRRAVGPRLAAPDAAPTLDVSGLLVAPGFIDLQINGALGIDLADEPERLWEVGAALSRYGVTGFLPTIITSPAGTPERAMAALADRPTGFAGAEPLGLHLEGPMLNPDRRGAHDPALLRLPSPGLVEGWTRADGVALVTLAPELPGGLAVVEQLVEAGVVVSAGHTAATADELDRAVAAGLSYVTHLFNAMVPFGHRDPGPIGLALSDGRLTAGLIADGIHVHPIAVAAAWRALGPSRLSLVTDAVAALGRPPGRFPVGGQNGHARRRRRPARRRHARRERARPRRGGAEPHRLHRVLAGRVHRDRHRDARPGPRPPAQGIGGARLRRRSHPAHRRSPGRHHLRRRPRGRPCSEVAAWRS